MHSKIVHAADLVLQCDPPQAKWFHQQWKDWNDVSSKVWALGPIIYKTSGHPLRIKSPNNTDTGSSINALHTSDRVKNGRESPSSDSMDITCKFRDSSSSWVAGFDNLLRQSDKSKYLPTLYCTFMLYWVNLSINHCILGEVSTSGLSTRFSMGLWSVYSVNCLPKRYWWKCSTPVTTPKISCSILLYLDCVSVKAFDINEIGLPFCNNTAPKPDWLASVSIETGRSGS